MGRRFADLEIQILLTKMFRKYKLEYTHEPLSMTFAILTRQSLNTYLFTFSDYEIIGGMYVPKGQLKFKMTPREE
jgi:hypothetical protein